jgi:hypothetical protein
MLILAYEGYRKYLEGSLTWKRFKEHALEPYPAIKQLHETYKLIGRDSIREKATEVPKQFRERLKSFDEKWVQREHDLIVVKCNHLLPPKCEIDVYFYLGVINDCLCVTVDGKPNVVISILHRNDVLPLILIHEYSHCLHEHNTAKPLVEGLKMSVVSEGIACYFPLLISQDYTIYDCLWMMPKEDVDWCLQNHDRVVDALGSHLDSNDSDVYRMFYIGGEQAEPPEGFPQKTVYYLGYRVIESCIHEMPIKQICRSTADAILEMSGLFSAV